MMKSIFGTRNRVRYSRYFSIIISLVILFSLFSSLIVPALSAKNKPVNSEKDTQVEDSGSQHQSQDSAPSVETQPSSSPSDDSGSQDQSQESRPSADSQTPSLPSDDDSGSQDQSQESQPSVDSQTPSLPSDDDSGSQHQSQDPQSAAKPLSEPNLSTPKVNSSTLPAIENQNGLDAGIKDNNAVKTFNFKELNDSSDENTVKHYTSKIGNISKNQTVSVTVVTEPKKQATVSIQKTKIETVEFKASSSKGNVEISVKNLKEKPDDVNENMNISDQSKVYEYLDIKLTSGDEYIGETGIQKMNFTFTVSKEWIENESIDKYSVKMMRYHNHSWQILNTSYVNESDDEIRFKAATPGLSVFAVVGDKVVEDSDEIIVETNDMPLWMPFSVILASTATLGIVLFKKRFVYNP